MLACQWISIQICYFLQWGQFKEKTVKNKWFAPRSPYPPCCCDRCEMDRCDHLIPGEALQQKASNEERIDVNAFKISASASGSTARHYNSHANVVEDSPNGPKIIYENITPDAGKANNSDQQNKRRKRPSKKKRSKNSPNQSSQNKCISNNNNNNNSKICCNSNNNNSNNNINDHIRDNKIAQGNSSIHSGVWNKGTVLIVGDSMLFNINDNTLSRTYNTKVRSFPGSTVIDLHDYIKPLLRKQPEKIILVLGTNDIAHESVGDLLQRIKVLVNFILEELPTYHVIVSEIIRREKYSNLNEKISRCNQELKSMKIDILRQQNILFEHIGRRGLNLNPYGDMQLAKNLVSKIRSFSTSSD